MNDNEPTEFLTLEDILAVGTAYLGRRPQVRDYDIFEAAAGRPRAVVFGEPVYRDIHFKAGALLHALVKGHALVDGNEPFGLRALRLFYALNSYPFIADDDQKFDLVMDVTEGRLVGRGGHRGPPGEIRPLQLRAVTASRRGWLLPLTRSVRVWSTSPIAVELAMRGPVDRTHPCVSRDLSRHVQISGQICHNAPDRTPDSPVADQPRVGIEGIPGCTCPGRYQ